MTYEFPRCQIVPLPEHQAAFEIDGAERLRWHFGAQYPRPFFYPLTGPSGSSLTRMGHPGAENHDHHRSVWFAHQKVLGIDFWSDRTEARIRQKNWLVYDDGPDECVMAVLLGWYDGHDPKELLEQELIAVVRPGPNRETFLELHSTFRPKSESLEFGQTNFGFLAVRVAKSLSEFFGGGELSNSRGATGEPSIFGTQAEWMDYSGPVPTRQADGTTVSATDGMTYFDHPHNPGYPTHWHVREDGWMGASVCMHAPLQTRRDSPLTLRYLLHLHRGPVDKQRAADIAREFAARPGYKVQKAVNVKHRQYVLARSPIPVS